MTKLPILRYNSRKEAAMQIISVMVDAKTWGCFQKRSALEQIARDAEAIVFRALAVSTEAHIQNRFQGPGNFVGLALDATAHKERLVSLGVKIFNSLCSEETFKDVRKRVEISFKGEVVFCEDLGEN